MKSSNENNSRFVKPVFGKANNNYECLSSYPLGEDFYDVHVEDDETNAHDDKKIKVSKNKAGKGYGK